MESNRIFDLEKFNELMKGNRKEQLAEKVLDIQDELYEFKNLLSSDHVLIKKTDYDYLKSEIDRVTECGRQSVRENNELRSTIEKVNKENSELKNTVIGLSRKIV